MEYPLLNNTPPELDSSSIQDDKLKEYRRKNRLLILIVTFFALIIVGLVLSIFSDVKNSLTNSKSSSVYRQPLEPTPTNSILSIKTYAAEDGAFSFNYPGNWTYEDVSPGKPVQEPTTRVNSFTSDRPVIKYEKIIEFKYEPRFAIFTIMETNADTSTSEELLTNIEGSEDRQRFFNLGAASARELTGCFGVEGCFYEHIIFVSHKEKNYRFEYTANSNVLSPDQEAMYNEIIASLKFNP